MQQRGDESERRMLRSELHYDLPPELIAQTPADRRDASRLLVLDRFSGAVRHERFERLPDVLPSRAVLVLNDTRVLPARLHLHRATGGRLEGLFLRELASGEWEMMMTGAGRVKPGEALTVGDSDQRLILLSRSGETSWQARPEPAGAVLDLLTRYGSPPLPPYILRQRGGDPAVDLHRQSGNRNPQWDDSDRYQTVYARQPGAVAAPTAGLHFTPELLDALRARGFETHFVTLHVGVGTFAPIRVDDLSQHVMHAEWYECSPGVADAVNAARVAGRKIVAVGTTSVRVLETCAGRGHPGRGEAGETPAPRTTAGSGWTRLFIYPPYAFRVVDAMITNFHLPESTLLAMVFAFAGRENVLAAYQQAMRERYRFYSYGDAMLIR
jgi:S-adenosylmethionine:tRNA ribosyltransferase-isomerase